jgi:site-specific recombinase XerD
LEQVLAVVQCSRNPNTTCDVITAILDDLSDDEEHASFQDQYGKITVLQSDIDAFRASPRAMEANHQLKQCAQLSVRRACNVRNLLLAELLFDNNCRPSHLVCLTIADVNGAKKDPKESSKGQRYYQVCSMQSKNVCSSGQPAYILITEEMMEKLEAYKRVARPALARETSTDDMFLLENGEVMTSDNVSRSIRYIWTAAGKTNKAFKVKANS